MNSTMPNQKLQTPHYVFALLVIFFLLKIIHVSTPLFHDELGVYGRALFYMMDNGPTMIPGQVDPEISRGHPLFFAFFIGLVGTWFGGTYIPVRIAILLLSLWLLHGTYQLGKELSNKWVGLFAAILLSFQPLFFAQSTLILPEIMLSLLGTLSLLYYVRKNYFLYFIFASLLVLTKETAVVILAGIALYEWQQHQFKINFASVKNIAKWMLPISCLFLFLSIQKLQHGWFLYPYHTDFISFSVGQILIRLFLSVAILFFDQGRFILTIAVLIALYKMPKERRILLIQQNSLLIWVVLMMFAFSGINYFMPRYFLLIFPLVLIFFTTIILERAYSIKHLLLFFIATLPFQCSFLVFRNDDDMGYLIVVQNMQKSIAELDKITAGQPAKVLAHFPENNALEDPRNGYTTNPNYTLTDTYDETVHYILKSDNTELISNKTTNNVIDNPEKNIYQVLNNEEALKKYNIELLYQEKLMFNTQRIFKTSY